MESSEYRVKLAAINKQHEDAIADLNREVNDSVDGFKEGDIIKCEHEAFPIRVQRIKVTYYRDEDSFSIHYYGPKITKSMKPWKDNSWGSIHNFEMKSEIILISKAE